MCAVHCVQLLHTICLLHRTDLIIFPLALQTIIIAPMMSIWGKNWGKMTLGQCQNVRDWENAKMQVSKHINQSWVTQCHSKCLLHLISINWQQIVANMCSMWAKNQLCAFNRSWRKCKWRKRKWTKCIQNAQTKHSDCDWYRHGHGHETEPRRNTEVRERAKIWHNVSRLSYDWDVTRTHQEMR